MIKNPVLLFSLFFTCFISCNKKEEKQVDENSARNAEMVKQNAAKEKFLSPVEEGKQLLEGADCLTCHKVDTKFVGPSYLDVVGKYEKTPENIELLASRIINGSVGIWGQTPMSAHPGMSKENAKKMVEYIFTLKK